MEIHNIQDPTKKDNINNIISALIDKEMAKIFGDLKKYLNELIKEMELVIMLMIANQIPDRVHFKGHLADLFKKMEDLFNKVSSSNS